MNALMKEIEDSLVMIPLGKRKNHIIFFSGGKASFAVADFVKTRYPNDNILLYFNDTLWEQKDLYRFIDEASDKLQLPMLIQSAGLNPMQLMFEKKLVFNSMLGDCSKILKIQVASRFLKKNIKPKIEKWRNKEFLKQEDFKTGATLYFGIDFSEMQRQDSIIENWKPFRVEMPLIDNYIDTKAVLKKYGIKQPFLYDLGFSHNNCAARCVKAGQGHYKNMKDKLPTEFQKLMEQEYHLRICVSAYRYIIQTHEIIDGVKVPLPAYDIIPEHVQKTMLKELDDAYRDYFYDRAPKPKMYIHPCSSAISKYMKIQQYSFMKKGTGEYEWREKKGKNGEKVRKQQEIMKPYPLRDLQVDVDNDKQIDMFDIGGCGCSVDGKNRAERLTLIGNN
jgi:hypothetical protein